MGIVGFAALGVTIGLAVLILKSVNKEAAMLALTAGGVILAFAALELVSGTLDLFGELSDEFGIDEGILKIVFKVIAICYVTEFSASLLADFDMASLSQKIVLIGKITVIVAAYPLFQKFAGVIKSLA